MCDHSCCFKWRSNTCCHRCIHTMRKLVANNTSIFDNCSMNALWSLISWENKMIYKYQSVWKTTKMCLQPYSKYETNWKTNKKANDVNMLYFLKIYVWPQNFSFLGANNQWDPSWRDGFIHSTIFIYCHQHERIIIFR